MADRRPERGQQGRRQPARENVASRGALLMVGGVRQLALPAPHRDAEHAMALAFELDDLGPDEAVADFRILVDQIGEAKGRGHAGARTPSAAASRSTTRAGAPTAVAPAGTSLSTTESAPMRQPSPSRTSPSTWA